LIEHHAAGVGLDAAGLLKCPAAPFLVLSPGSSAVPPQVLGRYHLVRKLAIGGMGEVWLAKQKGVAGFEKLVVVKTLLAHLKEDQEFVNMFFDEARIAAVLTHPNIAQIYDLGEDKGEYYIAMEYVHGLSLRDVLVHASEAKGGMPLALKCRVVADAASALDFAHRAKTPSGQPLDLIHRDVSPQNILIGFNGAVKLIDFGVAKAANKLVRTATGIIKGKYAYMSPEQAYGKDLDGRSDVFGLGIVFWEILCTERLFKRDNETETLRAVVGAPIHPPSRLDRQVPKALDAIVLKALERDREARYQTAGELRQAIEGFLAKQRLPATSAHLAAFMRELFPDDVEPEPVLTASGEVTHSTDKSAPTIDELGEPSGSDAPRLTQADQRGVLDARELEARIAGTSPSDTVRGMFFNALITAVLRLVGASAEPQLRKAAREPKAYVDSLAYPTPEFLRMLWKAVELLAPKRMSIDDAFEQLGHYTMDALLKSPFGKSLEGLKAGGPRALFKPLLATLNPMISPGHRLVSESDDFSASLVFKEEVLPIQVYVGLFRSLCQAFFHVELTASWEKTAAERVELELSWRS
jgi:serine/threonine-protein kinase